MVTPLEWVVWGALLVASAVFAGVGITTYRQESFPGATSFAAYCLALAVMLLGFTGTRVFDHLIGDAAPSGYFFLVGLVILLLTFGSVLLAPLAWLRFVLAYTGQRIPTSRRTLGLVGLPVVVTLASMVVLAGLEFAFTVIGSPVPDPSGTVVPAVTKYLLSATTFYIAALLVAGAALVGWTSYTHRHLSTRGGAYLGVGSVLPWAALVVPETAGLLEDFFLMAVHVAGGGAIGAAAVLAAVYRYGVFEQVPAAGTIGRNVTVEEMDDPVVVVDETHVVVDLNGAAERLFGVSAGTVGAPLDDLVDEDVAAERLLTGDATEFELDGSSRVVEAKGSELRDEYGRLLGHSVVFRDVTDRKRREQRIQVLNRVLRHNLRNDMSVVNGYAEALAAMSVDLQRYPEQIIETADGLVGIGEKAREIERVVATDGGGKTSVSTIIARAVDDARGTHPDCTFAVEDGAPDLAVDETVVYAALHELLDNAAEHNDGDDPHVTVAAEVTGDGRGGEEGPDGESGRTVVVTVTDDGPGIPEHELTPIREGTETDLEHGSGLGLWLVEWGVTAVDGSVSFESGEDGGTTVTVRVPAGG